MSTRNYLRARPLPPVPGVERLVDESDGGRLPKSFEIEAPTGAFVGQQYWSRLSELPYWNAYAGPRVPATASYANPGRIRVDGDTGVAYVLLLKGDTPAKSLSDDGGTDFIFIPHKGSKNMTPENPTQSDCYRPAAGERSGTMAGRRRDAERTLTLNEDQDDDNFRTDSVGNDSPRRRPGKRSAGLIIGIANLAGQFLMFPLGWAFILYLIFVLPWLAVIGSIVSAVEMRKRRDGAVGGLILNLAVA